MWLVVAAAIAVGTPDRGTVENVQLTYDVRGTATLSFVVSARELVGQTTTLTIDVPRGARVIAMAVTIGGLRTDAKATGVRAAAEQFQEIVDRKQDPALLEYAESTRETDRLTLQVFPVAKTSPARIEIVIEAPEANAVPRRHVTKFTSLLAGEPEPRSLPVIARRQYSEIWCSADRH